MAEGLIFGGLIVVFVLGVAVVILLSLSAKTAEVMGDEESAKKLENIMNKKGCKKDDVRELYLYKYDPYNKWHFALNDDDFNDD